MLFPKKSILSIYLFSLSFVLGTSVSAESSDTTKIDNKLHIYFCGTGDPTPASQEVRKPSCLAVRAGEDFLLFDAGEGSAATLASMHLPYGNISKIFMTHWHSDHFAGLGQVINATWYSAHRQKRMDIYGPYGIDEVIDGIKKSYRLDTMFRAVSQNMDPTIVFPRTHLISTDAKGRMVYHNNDISVSAFEVNHKPVYPAFGYEINYKGCKIIISGDTRVTPSLEEHAKNADVLINEALNVKLYEASGKGNRTKEQIESIESYHSDTLQLAPMAERAKVKRLYITHFVPSIPATKEAEQAFIQGMDKLYSGPIQPTEDKDELVIESKSAGSCDATYISNRQ